MWDYGYIPKEKDYPKPFLTPDPETTEYDETEEISDTLESIKFAETKFGYIKEDRSEHGDNFDYTNERPMTEEEIKIRDKKLKKNKGIRWWTNLTKDHGENGMNVVPLANRHGYGVEDSSDEEKEEKKEEKKAKKIYINPKTGEESDKPWPG